MSCTIISASRVQAPYATQSMDVHLKSTEGI